VITTSARTGRDETRSAASGSSGSDCGTAAGRSQPGPLATVALLAFLVSAPCAAQSFTGFSAGEATARQHRAEREVVSLPMPDSARRHAIALTREAHVAGTPAQLRTAEYVAREMQRWGLETEIRSYDVWMPHATIARLWRIEPGVAELPLDEPPVDEDPESMTEQYPAVNGYSGVGDVSGDLVFVNFGLIEDYAALDSMGVSVRGKIAIARYGRSFRGIKAREAERNGATALIMYSDPADDGYVRGDYYPEGPMRPPFGVQRGSVMNAIGDPTTPGYASLPGAPRLGVDDLPIPRIPVIPIGYGTASQILAGLRGPSIPQSWQGGLPFRYHIGPGPVRVRVLVGDDRETRPLKRIHNTLTTIRGSEFPDEVIVVGAHRDAWGPGAVDNVSGTASVLEAARAIARLAAAGQPPRRTIVFATWDAEEWGLIGSTEHVEQDSVVLWRNGVAYLNQDVAASGPRFGAGGSPSLRELLRDVARVVPHPAGGALYDRWRLESGVADSLEPPMGDPGGGSDFAGFYNHLGIPHADWGFGGPGGIYHSHYDSFTWMLRFGDPEFAYHATASRVAAAMLLRLANADIVPYDYEEYAATMRRHVAIVVTELERQGYGSATTTPAARLGEAVRRMAAAAEDFAGARDSALQVGIQPKAQVRVNAALRLVERALTRTDGLRSRPWYRNVVYAADEDNGYSTVVFPTVREAMRRRDAGLVATELEDLAVRFEEAAEAITAARREIR
jgi:N-acetylated-alpha-linked acidic dipeptidase